LLVFGTENPYFGMQSMGAVAIPRVLFRQLSAGPMTISPAPLEM
jgi:hypothetical protein